MTSNELYKGLKRMINLTIKQKQKNKEGKRQAQGILIPINRIAPSSGENGIAPHAHYQTFVAIKNDTIIVA